MHLPKDEQSVFCLPVIPVSNPCKFLIFWLWIPNVKIKWVYSLLRESCLSCKLVDFFFLWIITLIIPFTSSSNNGRNLSYVTSYSTFYPSKISLNSFFVHSKSLLPVKSKDYFAWVSSKSIILKSWGIASCCRLWMPRFCLNRQEVVISQSSFKMLELKATEGWRVQFMLLCLCVRRRLSLGQACSPGIMETKKASTVLNTWYLQKQFEEVIGQ